MEEKLLLVGMLYKSTLVIVVIQSCGVHLASAVSGTYGLVRSCLPFGQSRQIIHVIKPDSDRGRKTK